MVKSEAARTERAIMVFRSFEYSRAMAGGMVRRAITRMTPTTRSRTTTVRAIRRIRRMKEPGHRQVHHPGILLVKGYRHQLVEPGDDNGKYHQCQEAHEKEILCRDQEDVAEQETEEFRCIPRGQCDEKDPNRHSRSPYHPYQRLHVLAELLANGPDQEGDAEGKGGSTQERIDSQEISDANPAKRCMGEAAAHGYQAFDHDIGAYNATADAGYQACYHCVPEKFESQDAEQSSHLPMVAEYPVRYAVCDQVDRAMVGCRQHLLGDLACIMGEDPAIEAGHPRDMRGYRPDIMRDEKNGHGSQEEIVEQIEKLHLGGEIDIHHRLVKDEEVRVPDKRPCNNGSLLLTSGEVGDRPTGEMQDAGPFQGFLGCRPIFPVRNAGRGSGYGRAFPRAPYSSTVTG